MNQRVVLLGSTPRVPPGLLSLAAWQELQAGRVFASDPEHPQLAAVSAAGVPVSLLTGPAAEVAGRLAAAAAGGRSAVWLAGPDGDPELAAALGRLAREPAGVVVELLPGAWDSPGARLLDVVAVIDRLRSPGGCPWDAEQTHESLAPYLLEEAYEAYAAIEEGDLGALREELGDVLIQVAFHARLAEERPAGEAWSIDDLAGDLVAKLIRRHPHVFGSTDAPSAAHVAENWERIKAAEKGRSSVTDGVPLGQPALALAAKLQHRAARAGFPAQLHPVGGETLAAEVAALAARVEEAGDPVAAIGELLFAAVALARDRDVDPEAALRGAARRYVELVRERESAG